jgi:glycosidase
MGFSSFDGDLYLPLDDDKCNVEDQIKDPASILNFIKGLIKIRENNWELTSQEFNMYHIDNRVISYSRGGIKVVINLSDHPIYLNDVNEVIYDSCCLADKNVLPQYCGVIYK